MAQPATGIATIIGLWPTTQTFADDLGLKRGADHARVMKVRRRIPRRHWPRVLEAAQARGIPLTQQTLETAHTASREAAE
jgi:hypothetical protein